MTRIGGNFAKWDVAMGYHSVFRKELFQDQTIIITGGGSGIGRCTAHELAALGSHVAIIGRKQEKLDRVAGEIQEDGGSVETHSCDIRDEAKVAETVSKVVKNRGQIHGLVNNAGGQFPSPIAAINQKGFETVVRTNLVGGFFDGTRGLFAVHEPSWWFHRQYNRGPYSRNARYGAFRWLARGWKTLH